MWVPWDFLRDAHAYGVRAFFFFPFSFFSFAMRCLSPIWGFRETILESTLEVADGTDGPLQFAVVGAGAGGVEICLCMCYRVHNELKKLGRDPKK